MELYILPMYTDLWQRCCNKLENDSMKAGSNSHLNAPIISLFSVYRFTDFLVFPCRSFLLLPLSDNRLVNDLCCVWSSFFLCSFCFLFCKALTIFFLNLQLNTSLTSFLSFNIKRWVPKGLCTTESTNFTPILLAVDNLSPKQSSGNLQVYWQIMTVLLQVLEK